MTDSLKVAEELIEALAPRNEYDEATPFAIAAALTSIAKDLRYLADDRRREKEAIRRLWGS